MDEGSWAKGLFALCSSSRGAGCGWDRVERPGLAGLHGFFVRYWACRAITPAEWICGMMSLFRRVALLALILVSGTISAAMAQPTVTVTSGKIVSTTVDVTRTTGSLAFTLHIKGPANGIYLSLQGPSGEVVPQSFGGTYNGAVSFQAAGTNNAFSLYSEPGLWTILSLQACQTNLGCHYYAGSELQALFPSVTFTLANPNVPDFTPPVALHGDVKTPTVSISNGPVPELTLRATDNVSGLAAAYVCASNVGNTANICFSLSAPPRPITNGVFTVVGFPLQPNTPTGVYTVASINLVDFANNNVQIYDAGVIAKLFGNKASITVTN